MANLLRFSCKWRVGFIDWLGFICEYRIPPVRTYNSLGAGPDTSRNIRELCRDQCANPRLLSGKKWAVAKKTSGSLQPTARSYFCFMKMLIRVLAVVSISGLLSVTARADAVATLSGIVRDAKGAPLRGAEIRIVGSDPSKVGRIHTDAAGRYNYAGLETGTYSVTLVVNGVTKASINNVSTKSGEVQTLNFDLQGNATARPFAKGKHYVWVPKQTGSHLGTWAEVENDGQAMPSGMSERISNAGNAFLQKQLSNNLHTDCLYSH